MELHAEARQLAVLGAHHEPVLGPRGELKRGRKIAALHDEGVVAPCLERDADAFEDAPAFMEYERGLPVHRRGAVDRSAGLETERLMAQAHTQHWRGGRQGIEELGEASGVARVPRSGGE